jgi:hypothetical protein
MATVTNPNVTNAGDLAGLLVSAKQDAIFAGYESSIYLPGVITDIHNVPAGSVTAQIPKFSAVATTSVETEVHGATSAAIAELDIINVAAAGVDVSAQSYAARAMLKDLGGMNAGNVGTVLGRAVSEKFDTDFSALFTSVTNSVGAAGAGLTVALLAQAVQKVRASKFAGQLWMVLHPSQVEDILLELAGTAAIPGSGSDAMNEALRNGIVGSLFGANIIQSASLVKDGSDDFTGCVWAENAFGVAMFKGLDVVSAQNITGLGTDIVASLHAKAALVDTTRACKIISAE